MVDKKAQEKKLKFFNLPFKKGQGIKSKILPASLFSKKAQMKIQQMAFMLIAIMVFFALVGLLIVSLKFSGLKEQATELQSENAMLLVSKLANSPEFSCGNALGSSINCIDSDKIMALKNNIGEYKDFWGVSNIEIIKIYPPYESKKLCNSATYPNCNTISLISEEVSGVAYSNFVALCRKEVLDSKTYNKCELAKLMVSYKNV